MGLANSPQRFILQAHPCSALKRKPPPPIPWFRLRCAACAFLAAGAWLGVIQASLQGRNADATIGAGGLNASPLTPSTAKARPSIIIDPGHGGKDPGKVAGSQLEKTWTLQLSLTLAEELRRRGLPAELTRTEDTTLTPGDRSALANREDRAAFVSIHFNSGRPEANGIEVFYAWPKSPATMLRLDAGHRLPAGTTLHDDRGRLLAESLQSAACNATGARNRGVKNDPTLAAVLNHTLCPAVLIECGFLTNAAECANIQSEEWRKKLVTGLADSLEQWTNSTADVPGYGITFTPAAGTPAAVIHSAPTAAQ